MMTRGLTVMSPARRATPINTPVITICCATELTKPIEDARGAGGAEGQTQSRALQSGHSSLPFFHSWAEHILYTAVPPNGGRSFHWTIGWPVGLSEEEAKDENWYRRHVPEGVADDVVFENASIPGVIVFARPDARRIIVGFRAHAALAFLDCQKAAAGFFWFIFWFIFGFFPCFFLISQVEVFPCVFCVGLCGASPPAFARVAACSAASSHFLARSTEARARWPAFPVVPAFTEAVLSLLRVADLAEDRRRRSPRPREARSRRTSERSGGVWLPCDPPLFGTRCSSVELIRRRRVLQLGNRREEDDDAVE